MTRLPESQVRDKESTRTRIDALLSDPDNAAAVMRLVQQDPAVADIVDRALNRLAPDVVTPRTVRTHSEDLVDVDARITDAALEWIGRNETRDREPDGTATPKGYWTPTPGERRPCCQRHYNSATFRRAIHKHCKGYEHVAALFNVPVDAVRAAVRLSRA